MLHARLGGSAIEEPFQSHYSLLVGGRRKSAAHVVKGRFASGLPDVIFINGDCFAILFLAFQNSPQPTTGHPSNFMDYEYVNKSFLKS
jgi:hypothetical protein